MIAAVDPLQSMPTDWDVVVVGAGLAGGLSALLHARAGLRTLLIEAKAFPRSKVCGCCLNATAWSILERHGLTQALLNAGAVRLNTIRLTGGGQVLSHRLHGMYAIGRDVLDQTIVEYAVAAGAHFVSETRAKVGPVSGETRTVELESDSATPRTITARVVVCADGLGHPSLGRDAEFAADPQQGSRFGLGATFASSEDNIECGVLRMVVGTQGYVGLTRVQDGKLNIAAAVERSLLTRTKHACEAIRSILIETGQPIPQGFDTAQWTGTPALTRISARQASERLFLIGDAAAYVEPFTGEGMAWGLAGAELSAAIVQTVASRWDRQLSQEWERKWTQHVKRRQWTCRALSTILKSPRLTRWGLRLGHMFPAIPTALIRGISDSGC